jgi:hypothetical protein
LEGVRDPAQPRHHAGQRGLRRPRQHLSSGRRQRFASGKELLGMVMRLLHDLDAPSKDQKRRGAIDDAAYLEGPEAST